MVLDFLTMLALLSVPLQLYVITRANKVGSITEKKGIE